jgi:hypothetical protein
MCIGVLETASPTVLRRVQKSSLCKTIWLIFVCAHTRSYVFTTYENVSGSFETPSCFRNVRTPHELVYVRKVVSRSLPRFLLVYATCRHVITKRHEVIRTSVSTQETKRDLRIKPLFWTRRTTSAGSVSQMVKDMADLDVHPT